MGQIGPRQGQRGDQTEEHTAAQRYEDGECHDTDIERRLADPGNVVRGEGEQQVGRRGGEADAERRTEPSNDQGLGQQLLGYPATAGAQGTSYRLLPVSFDPCAEQ